MREQHAKDDGVGFNQADMDTMVQIALKIQKGEPLGMLLDSELRARISKYAGQMVRLGYSAYEEANDVKQTSLFDNMEEK
jgi:hypothetical protein